MLPGVIDRRFHLEREVGGGGMGRIWRARDAETGRDVAIKIMTTDAPIAIERFHREAVTLASIRHPGIVDYIAHGVVEGKPYLVMEWLEGMDLSRRLRDVRMEAFATLPARPRLVQLEVQRDAERRGPVALEDVAVEVDADDVLRTELLPREEPRVAEQRAVALVHRDVAGEVVVVALVPERTRQQDDLLALGELRAETVGRGSERHLSRP